MIHKNREFCKIGYLFDAFGTLCFSLSERIYNAMVDKFYNCYTSRFVGCNVFLTGGVLYPSSTSRICIDILLRFVLRFWWVCVLTYFEYQHQLRKCFQNSDDGKLHITWNKPEELEAYIRQLQQAAEKLTTKNRLLRKQHVEICDKVVNRLHVIVFLIRCSLSDSALCAIFKLHAHVHKCCTKNFPTRCFEIGL